MDIHDLPGDLDIWINNTTQNAQALIKVIDEFGFEGNYLKELNFEKETMAFHLGTPPVRIDIMNRIAGVKFPECFKRRVELAIENIKINYISFQDLITNKKAVADTKT